MVELRKALCDEGQCLVDRVICGHFLHMLCFCSRWSDLLAVQNNVYLDECGVFLEAETIVHKGARGFNAKTKLLPVVALARGICDDQWAHTYLQLRRQAGLTESAPIMVAPDRTMDTSFVSAIIFQEAACACSQQKGVHTLDEIHIDLAVYE